MKVLHLFNYILQGYKVYFDLSKFYHNSKGVICGEFTDTFSNFYI